MKVYVFGNEDFPRDNNAIKAALNLKNTVKGIEFIFVKPNEDLPFINENKVVIMDVVENIDNVITIADEHIDKISLPPRSTAHDFDLGFQLKYLKKLGKLGIVTIIGIPITGKLDYLSIQSILRKLVAQDMQGS